MRLRLKPRDNRFFDLFSVAGSNIATATAVLREFVTVPTEERAEISAASVLYLTAFVFHAPVSTTHIVTSAVMGGSATQRRKAVRWSVAGEIAVGWVLTFPGSASIAALAYTVLNLV